MNPLNKKKEFHKIVFGVITLCGVGFHWIGDYILGNGLKFTARL